MQERRWVVGTVNPHEGDDRYVAQPLCAGITESFIGKLFSLVDHLNPAGCVYTDP